MRVPRFPVGVWAPAEADCATLDESGYLPLLVGSTKAAAGGATCRYKSTEPDGRVWRVTAVCSDGSGTWTAHVGLEEAAGRLRWTSERGTVLYRRCPGEPSSLKGAGVGPGPAGDVPGRVTKG
ncbi:hypothetical protein [Enterovirga aerilata]|uniref:Uncharacterized protein n=1 Tax=Enterovirga aerilata TaxID=2730920 RepID=A0A849IG85_9HYPH|nr:hypothetical protein [Enterovirga sp. DB1703]NNM75190.1 hypothetical protein [Enterovirga sp. DB1703]